MSALKVTGSFDCPSHPNTNFCTCPVAKAASEARPIGATTGFVLCWEGSIIVEDNCFLYTGSESNAALFQVKMGGTTPAMYVQEWLKAQGSPYQFFEPMTSEKHLVQAMLDFWADRAKQWRSEYKTKEDARTACKERLNKSFTDAGRPGLSAAYMQNVVEVSFGQPGHMCTAQVLPVLANGEVEYNIQRFDDFHPGCGRHERNMSALQVKLAERYDHDLKVLTGGG